MTLYEPMVHLRNAVIAAASEVGQRVVIGANAGAETTPFVVLRSVSGPPRDAQVPQQRRRVDVQVFADTAAQAHSIAAKINHYFHNRPASATINLPVVYDEVGPIDLVDEDRRLPFVLRSYFLLYGDD